MSIIFRSAKVRVARIILPVMLVMLAACAPKVSTKVMLPATYPEATSVRRVAVVPLQGESGPAVARAMESRLTEIRVDNSAYFTVIDRQTIDKVVQEQSFSYSGLVDPNTASRLGAILGAEGIYTGTVNRSVNDSRYITERNVCVARNSKGACSQWQKRNVRCTKRVARMEFMPRLVDVSTGRVLYAPTVVKSTDSNLCADEKNRVIMSPDAMYGLLQNVMLNEFATHVAPHTVTMQLKLMDDDEGIGSKKNKQALESGIDFAKAGRFDRACEIWNRALVEEGKSLSLHYNVGVCLETGSRYDEALSRYRAADRLLTEPNKTVSAALSRIQERINEQNELNKQLN